MTFDPREIHRQDQAGEAFRQLGITLFLYHTAMVAAGFDYDQAMTLTVDYQAFILHHSSQQEADDD